MFLKGDKMKTKILVCSNSGIDYVPHSVNVASIPVILHFSEEEQYEDYLDVSTEAFYNRMRLDKNAHIRPTFQTYAKISEYIIQAKNEGYEQILFLLASKEFSDLYIPVSIAVSENKDIPCIIYSSSTCCYPLAYMAVEADNLFIQGSTSSEVIERLEHIRKNHHIFYFDPVCSNETSKSFVKKYKNGLMYSIENGKLNKIFNESKITSYDQIFKMISEEIQESEVVLFILYTNKSTKYINIIEETLLQMNLANKKVKSYPIPPGVGIQIGANTIGVGYIVK